MTGDPLTYGQAIEKLSGSLTFGINPSLAGIHALAEALGRPQDAFSCVQVTGTNGKTSVTRATGALLTAHGFRTGVYTSPHLVSYTERIEIDGAPVSEERFAAALSDVFTAAEALPGPFTEFELLTAAGLHLFREQRVDHAVLEVGMGGRWDATSVVAPRVAVITGVALDHTDRLGTTRREIAWDKAHIVKPSTEFVVTGPGCEGVDDIIQERADQFDARVMPVGRGYADWRITKRPCALGDRVMFDVFGLREYRGLAITAPAYQVRNVVVAMATCCAAMLSVLDRSVTASALANLTFPGRFEVLRKDPPLVIDGAHNPDAAHMLSGAIAEVFSATPPVIVLSVLAEKDAEGIVRALAPVARAFVVTHNGSPRCMETAALASVVESVTGVRPVVEGELARALEVASEDGLPVVVTGSLYTAGGVRRLLNG
ncbi:MAG: bifunctional folylpolyglutamate synthase/dihydrofolate synthase [Coriobacteriia bacterium]